MELIATILIVVAIAWVVRKLTAPPADYTDDKGRTRCGKCKKIVYSDEDGARNAAERAIHRGTYLRAYYDARCGYWHLTSQQPRY